MSLSSVLSVPSVAKVRKETAVALMDMEQAVLRKAQEEADAILAEAGQRAEARRERDSARLREEHTRRVEAMKAQLEGTLERDVGARGSEDRLKLLKVKNEIIEEVFAAAIDGIRALPDDGYARWLKKQLLRVPKTSAGKVVVNDADRETVARLLKELPEVAHLTLSENSAPIKAGLLIEGERADLDFSVGALLGTLRESLAQEIATRLFAEEAG